MSTTTKIPLYKMSHHSFWGRGQIAGREAILAKPMTFMNNSGQAAAGLCRAFGVLPANMLVAYDDMDLPAGTLRLRPQGGSGGHNGIRSIIDHLQTEAFPRMRIGIGRAAERDAADYVLERFTAPEEEILAEVLEQAVKATFLFAREGITAAMNRFNTQAKKTALQAQENVLE